MPFLPFTPPTDNLYKFVAIAGLVLVIAGFALPFKEFEDIETKILAEDLAKIDIIEKKQLLELNLKQLDKDITKVEKATSNPTDRIDLTQRARSANESDIKLEAESEKLIARVENLRRLNDSLWFWTILWRSVFFTGMVLTVLGFFLWYFRVQRLHDRVLRNEADKT